MAGQKTRSCPLGSIVGRPQVDRSNLPQGRWPRGNCLVIAETDHHQLGRTASREDGADTPIITDASSRKISTGECQHSGPKELKIDLISQRPREKHNPITGLNLQFWKAMVLGENAPKKPRRRMAPHLLVVPQCPPVDVACLTPPCCHAAIWGVMNWKRRGVRERPKQDPLCQKYVSVCSPLPFYFK